MRVNEIEEAFLQYLPGTSEPVEECLPPEFSHLGVVGKAAEPEETASELAWQKGGTVVLGCSDFTSFFHSTYSLTASRRRAHSREAPLARRPTMLKVEYDRKIP